MDDSLLALCIEEKARPPQEKPKPALSLVKPLEAKPASPEFCQSLKGAATCDEERGLTPMQREARMRVAFCLWHRGLKGGFCENENRLTGCTLWEAINRHGRRYPSALQEIRYQETLRRAKEADKDPAAREWAEELYHQAEEIFNAMGQRETE